MHLIFYSPFLTLQLSQKLIEVESQLSAFMKTLAAKDAELHKLREEKASTEIAFNSALQEKASVDHALETLKGDMGKVSKIEGIMIWAFSGFLKKGLVF